MSRSGSVPRSGSDKSKQCVFEEDVDPHLKNSITNNYYNFNLFSCNNSNNSHSNNGSKDHNYIVKLIVIICISVILALAVIFGRNLDISDQNDTSGKTFEISSTVDADTTPGTP